MSSSSTENLDCSSTCVRCPIFFSRRCKIQRCPLTHLARSDGHIRKCQESQNLFFSLTFVNWYMRVDATLWRLESDTALRRPLVFTNSISGQEKKKLRKKKKYLFSRIEAHYFDFLRLTHLLALHLLYYFHLSLCPVHFCGWVFLPYFFYLWLSVIFTMSHHL